MINTEKIIKYNHILFAIIATIALIGAILLLLISAIVFAQDIFKTTADIVIPKKDVPIQQYSQIKMLEPQLIDEDLRLFIIPISQVKLKEPISLKSKHSYSSYSSSYSRFNNLVLYNHSTETKQLIVNKRTLITKYAHKKYKEKRYIIFLGTQEDTNQNNQLDTEDKMSLYWYNVNSHELKETSLKKSIVSFDLSETRYKDQHNTKGIYPNEVIIQVKKDKDSSVFQILNLDNGNVRSIIPELLLKTIQEILDLGKDNI